MPKRIDSNGLITYKNSKDQDVIAKILPINEEGWLATVAISADTFSSHTMPILKAQLTLASGIYSHTFSHCIFPTKTLTKTYQNYSREAYRYI